MVMHTSVKHDIVVYGKPSCPFCQLTRGYLNERGLAFTYKELGKDYEVRDLQRLIPGVKTVPQVFVDGQLIGGYEDVKHHSF